MKYEAPVAEVIAVKTTAAIAGEYGDNEPSFGDIISEGSNLA